MKNSLKSNSNHQLKGDVIYLAVDDVTIKTGMLTHISLAKPDDNDIFLAARLTNKRLKVLQT